MRLLIPCILLMCPLWINMNALAEPVPSACLELLVNGQDSSGHGCSLENHGVEFGTFAPDGSRAARFDGRGAFLEAPNSVSPQFKAGNFTVSMWVYTKEELDEAFAK